MHKYLVYIVLTIVVLAGAGAYGTYRTMQANAPEKIYRVGILSGLEFFADISLGFKERMAELGYIEGKNIIYDEVKAPAPVGNEAAIQKFVDDGVDLIFVYPTEASLEAKKVSAGRIPIISTGAYMDDNGLIESVRAPGGNLTGVRFPTQEIAAKRFELLHEIVPNAKRIFIPFLKDYPTVEPALKAIRPKAAAAGVTLIERPFASPNELLDYVSSDAVNTNVPMDAILEIAEPLSVISVSNDALFKFADRHGIPVAASVLIDADYGPMFSLGPNNTEIGRLAAPLADKVFRGIDAGTIPVVTPESDLNINFRAIQKLGITVSESILSTAEIIIR
jgi:putative ABC transport system substrate-binding protein